MSTLENLPTGPQGHWYCSFCQDIQPNLRKPMGRWDSNRGVQCPTCRNMSADWVGDAKPKPAPLSPEHGKELFGKIYEEIKHLPKP